LFCSAPIFPVMPCPVLLGRFPSLTFSVLPILSCPVLSCPVLSCPVLSCPVLSCPVLSCPVLSCPVLSFTSFSFFSVLTRYILGLHQHDGELHVLVFRHPAPALHLPLLQDDHS
jgi:hypothetical protein